MSNGTTPERPTPHQEAWTFWLGASAEADRAGGPSDLSRVAPSQPIGAHPSRICRACGREVCLTNQRMFCECRTTPWALEEETE